jgi:hypothetical protein
MAKKAPVYRSKAISGAVICFGALSMVFLAYSTWHIYQHHDKNDHALSFILCAIWVIGSPLWFLWEYSVLFSRYGDHNEEDQFKRVQDLASKVWAGGIVILAAAATDAFPK